MAELRYYLDEMLPLEIARQLERSTIDVVSARSLDLLGAEDISHLRKATEMGRVLCTHDQVFLRLAANQSDHAGIAFAQQTKASIGGWVRALRSLHVRCSTEDMRGQVHFVSMGP